MGLGHDLWEKSEQGVYIMAPGTLPGAGLAALGLLRGGGTPYNHCEGSRLICKIRQNKETGKYNSLCC